MVTAVTDTNDAKTIWKLTQALDYDQHNCCLM
jgi:hypothetical protein